MDDLYPGTLSTESAPFGYADILFKIESLESELREVHSKKKKHCKKGNKKKLKKKVELLQMENEQIKYCLGIVAMQQQQDQQCQRYRQYLYKGKKKKKKQASNWWRDGLSNSIPIVLNNLTKQKSQYLPEKTQFYLSDGNDRR